MGFPDKKYDVIYADPPWTFKTYSAKGKGRSAENHYKTMSFKDICVLPVADIAKKDCVLLLWVTGPMLQKAFKLLDAWGFKYKTIGFTWMKLRKKADPRKAQQSDVFMGQGYWTRSNAELCLLATKGRPKRLNADVMQAILSPLREHSRKPQITYERIERLLGGDKIELFARNSRIGWDSWGNETNKFDKGELNDCTDPKSITICSQKQGVTFMSEQKESILEKIGDYAKAVGMTIEDAVKDLAAHVEANKAEIDAEQAEETEALEIAKAVDASENEEVTETATEAVEVEEATDVAETTEEAAQEASVEAESEEKEEASE